MVGGYVDNEGIVGAAHRRKERPTAIAGDLGVVRTPAGFDLPGHRAGMTVDHPVSAVAARNVEPPAIRRGGERMRFAADRIATHDPKGCGIDSGELAMPLPIRFDRREDGSAVSGCGQAMWLGSHHEPVGQGSGANVDDMDIVSARVGLPEKLATRILRACAR